MIKEKIFYAGIVKVIEFIDCGKYLRSVNQLYLSEATGKVFNYNNNKKNLQTFDYNYSLHSKRESYFT